MQNCLCSLLADASSFKLVSECYNCDCKASAVQTHQGYQAWLFTRLNVLTLHSDSHDCSSVHAQLHNDCALQHVQCGYDAAGCSCCRHWTADDFHCKVSIPGTILEVPSYLLQVVAGWPH